MWLLLHIPLYAELLTKTAVLGYSSCGSCLTYHKKHFSASGSWRLIDIAFMSLVVSLSWISRISLLPLLPHEVVRPSRSCLALHRSFLQKNSYPTWTAAWSRA